MNNRFHKSQGFAKLFIQILSPKTFLNSRKSRHSLQTLKSLESKVLIQSCKTQDPRSGIFKTLASDFRPEVRHNLEFWSGIFRTWPQTLCQKSDYLWSSGQDFKRIHKDQFIAQIKVKYMETRVFLQAKN